MRIPLRPSVMVSSLAYGCVNQIGSKEALFGMELNHLVHKISSLFLIGMLGFIVFLSIYLTLGTWKKAVFKNTGGLK